MKAGEYMLTKLLTCIEVAILFILWIVFFIIGPRYFTHIMSERIQVVICIILSFVTVKIFGDICYHIEVTKKPIQTTKAKVISTEYRAHKHGGIYSRYYAFFLINNGNKLELSISKKQYKTIKKNDIIELTYQGVIVYSIKNLADGTVIVNKSYSPKNMEFK